ncbi:hypothetical protein HYH03_001845 [Edaphochlamys debaryana]|uniref:Peptidase M11 gametolysin domain-containing protein n=1 Tax=Edaphochlamys debaryana TaxID=47281 RepID=A0A835YC78_9CHLO|nr:hypothetical protein HYH03_001845 [Edaphochlamys debaryana]|eukprot:KAG2500267.1 hypothetical protein HYH03_001845 [Edaphochlamys debaryana]
MGSGATCFNAAQMSILGWAAPVATISAASLPAGRWVTFEIPALSANPYNNLLVKPTWLPNLSSGPDARNLFVSYRAPVGCDKLISKAFLGMVELHSLILNFPESMPFANNITTLEAVVAPRTIWPAPAQRSLDGWRLAVRFVEQGPLSASAPWARVAICRYDVTRETGRCNNGLDDDCDGLTDLEDSDC